LTTLIIKFHIVEFSIVIVFWPNWSYYLLTQTYQQNSNNWLSLFKSFKIDIIKERVQLQCNWTFLIVSPSVWTPIGIHQYSLLPSFCWTRSTSLRSSFRCVDRISSASSNAVTMYKSWWSSCKLFHLIKSKHTTTSLNPTT